jgi:hypothetical protein
VREILGARIGRDIFIVSLSLDPERDTPEAMRLYAAHNGAKRGWTFATGARKDIDDVRRRLGLYDTPDYTQHMGLLTFGNEPEGKWAGTYALDTPENIAFHVLRRVDPFKFTPWPETPSPSAASRGGEQSRRRAPGRSKQVNVTSVAAASTQLGTIADNGGGSWTYTLAAGFTGTDTFLSAASCEQPPVAGTDSLTAGCYLTTRRSCRPMSPSARIWWTSWIARERVSTPPAHPYPDGDVRCCGILQRPEGHNL